MEAAIDALRVAFFQIPGGLGPGIGITDGDFLGQIHALEPREGLGRFQCLGLIQVIAGKDAAVLGTLVPQDTGQAAGIDLRNGHDIVVAQVVRQGLLATPVADRHGQIANHQAGRPDLRGLFVLGRHTGVANMRIGQGHNLFGVGGIRKDFLVAGHSGVEHHFTHGLTRGTDSNTPKDASVFKSENGGNRQRNLQAGKNIGRYAAGHIRKKARWIAPPRFFMKFVISAPHAHHGLRAILGAQPANVTLCRAQPTAGSPRGFLRPCPSRRFHPPDQAHPACRTIPCRGWPARLRPGPPRDQRPCDWRPCG